jgi:hypothetical protein
MALGPLTLRSSPGAKVVTSSAAIRVLRGPMVVVKRQGRTFVVTEGVVGARAAVAFQRGIELGSGSAPAAQQLGGAMAAEATPLPVASEPPGALPSSAPVAQAVTTTAKTAAAPAKTATTQVTQAVETATTAAGALPVSTAPLPTSTVAAPPPPPPPPLPVDTSPVTSALPPIPTVTLPSLP